MQEPQLWKLAPVSVTKPWGLVHAQALELTGIEAGIGELWLASAQTGPGNYSNPVVEPALGRALADLLAEAHAGGEGALEPLLGQPVLRHLRENPHRGKTEAWYIRSVRGRTGLASGPRTAQDAARLQELIQGEGLPPDVRAWSDEVRALFGIIEPLAGGEAFLAPAGALHTMFAVGPDSRLIIDELQQGYGDGLLPTLTKILMVQDDLLSVQVHPGDRTVADVAEGRLQIAQDLQANPTVRIYDFGRRPGEYPELGFRLVDPDVGLRRIAPVRVEVDGQHSVEVLVADPHFARSRLCLRAGACDLGPHHGSYRTLHCLCGSAKLTVPDGAMMLRRGETVFVPACFAGALRIETATGCALFDDALPDLAALRDFLESQGAGADQVDALLDPPRAI